MTSSAAALARIRFLILDVDGVLWHGKHALPGVPEFFQFIVSHSIRFVLATNNSARPTSEIVDRIAGLGVQVDERQVLTSAEATAMYLPRVLMPGGRVLLVGGAGIAKALTHAGYRLVERDAQAVVVGLDPALTYDKLRRATLEIRRGAQFIGTNADKTFPSEEGLIPGAGAIIAAIETATDVVPVVVGKPERPMFDIAIEMMGGAREETAIIGDRLDTDIQGAQSCAVTSILVLTGVTSPASVRESRIRPDFVFQDLNALRTAWQAEFSQPIDFHS